MKKFILLAVIATATTFGFMTHPDEPSQSALTLANIEALTTGEGYVDFDDYCNGPGNGCAIGGYWWSYLWGNKTGL